MGSDPATWSPNYAASSQEEPENQRSLRVMESGVPAKAKAAAVDDPILKASLSMPAVAEALARIKFEGTRRIKEEDWAATSSMLRRTIDSTVKTVETNGMSISSVSALVEKLSGNTAEFVDALNSLLEHSTVHRVGMGNEERVTMMMGLLSPFQSGMVGYTPIEAPVNTEIRQYKANVDLTTVAASDMIVIYFPASVEQNANNGCILYVEEYHLIQPEGIWQLVGDSSKVVIGTTQARWGHVSSGFIFRNVNATIKTLGTVSATALAPTTSELTKMTQSTMVNATRVVTDRNVSVVSQGREILVRNDVSTSLYTPKDRSTVTTAFFDDIIAQGFPINVTATNGMPTPSTFNLSPVRTSTWAWSTVGGHGFYDVGPYYFDQTPTVAPLLPADYGNGMLTNELQPTGVNPDLGNDALGQLQFPVGYTLPVFRGQSIIQLASLDLTATSDIEPIRGVEFDFTIKMKEVRQTAMYTDSTMQWVQVFAVAETKRGTTFGYPHKSTDPPGKVTAYQPFTTATPGSDPTYNPTALTNDPLGGNGPAGGDGGYYARSTSVIPVSTGERPNDGIAHVNGRVVIDCALGYVGPDGSSDGTFPEALGRSDGLSATGQGDIVTTLREAMTDPAGKFNYVATNVPRFENFRAYNIEKISLFAVCMSNCVLVSSGAATTPDGAINCYTVMEQNINVRQIRYQPDSQQRMAMLIASNDGVQSFGIETCVNVCSAPKVDEIAAHPVAGKDVVTADLVEATRIVPNAHVGPLISRGA